MNGLTLRVNPNNKKMKNTLALPPVALPDNAILETNNELLKKFSKSNLADEQLSVTKCIMDSVKDHSDPDVMSFLALVFLQAEPKHPVKCFIARHITKDESLQQPFAAELAKDISRRTNHDATEYLRYIDVVSKVATCMENFPAGSLAIKMIEIDLAEYLNDCLGCCINTLSNNKLAPTEKNDIFNISHLALRLLLYIAQKVNEDHISTFICMFKRLRIFLKYFMFDQDAPMDTKSICGILFVSMELLETGQDAWIRILEPAPTDDSLVSLLENEAARLSLYSAIATVVHVDRIQKETVAGQSAIICLTEKILAIGERSSSEPVFMLGVSRTVLQLSKLLARAGAPGAQLMELVVGFVWAHLDHHMDSVRHLAAQALANVVSYCTALERGGDETGLDRLFEALSGLDQSRKSYYVSLTALAAQLGWARVRRRRPRVVRDAVRALRLQPVQASATTALEMLLQKHAHECNTEALYQAWVVPILELVSEHELDSSVLNILENLVAKAVTLDDNVFNYMIPDIEASCSPSSPHRSGLKCALVLLSAARRAGRALPPGARGARGAVLARAAVDADDEVRILALSLVAESRKSTEEFSPEELEFVLYFLRYNINAQSPNFRQLMLSFMKKVIKRVGARQSPRAHYAAFARDMRAQCFGCLLRGANYSRSRGALQILVWLGEIHLEGYTAEWKEEYVDKLLTRLEDSYENNKELALQVLLSAPAELLQGKKYRVSLELDAILREASSMKPTDCVSAAYKLSLLTLKLPENILQGQVCSAPEPVLFVLLQRLLRDLQRELGVCRRSVVAGARHGPMYGLLHCLGHLAHRPQPDAISESEEWRQLIAELITACVDVNAAVACVVNNSSPEGHLPMDAAGVSVADHGNSGDVVLEDGRPVTAQMVLLCAWRSVKEVSLLLGTLASRLTIDGEGVERGTLSRQQMVLIGSHFTKLLAETKHRGAFEQAYVGFTRLLARLWRCRSSRLHGLGGAWLRALTAAVHAARPATRRSAGLPYMMQALLTTELQVLGSSKCLHECITTLLRLARTTSLDSYTATLQQDPLDDSDDLLNMFFNDSSSGTENNTSHSAQTDDVEGSEYHCSKERLIEARTHSVNILRALFRNSMLEESMAGYVGEGLIVALQGFEGETWMERNSSTLLFSALMVRIFGVARARHAAAPAPRNTMTGRIFFLRYPRMYDFILNKLKEAGETIEEQLHPSLCPVLVLLGRLYPSSLEGTASSLRLAALAARAARCGAGRALAARALAAGALAPLVQRYTPHLISVFTHLRARSISRNYCHGLLLQASRLLQYRPQESPASSELAGLVGDSVWLVEQACGGTPCYMLADEYVKVVNLLVWRLPSLVSDEMLTTIRGYLDKILFTDDVPLITSGREVCLANCIYLYFVILHKTDEEKLPDLIYKGLAHKSYDVILSTLNYLLIVYKQSDAESCPFQQHLSLLSNDSVLVKLRGSNHCIEELCAIIKNNKYLECVQKSLKVLILEKNTQKYIVAAKTGITKEMSDDEIIRHLFDFVQNEHENVTHIYLESLSNFVSGKVEDSSLPHSTLLEVVRVIYACCSSDNSDDTRHVVAGFLEQNFEKLLKMDLDDLSDEDKFELAATVYAGTAALLEDEDAGVRARGSRVVLAAAGLPRAVPARAARALRRRVARGDHADAMLVLLALVDFRCEVCVTDEISDECRVFDQNERYNTFLEESVWTDACAAELLQRRPRDAGARARQLVDASRYRPAIDKLCNRNVELFRKMFDDNTWVSKNDLVNPKIELFVSKLRQ